MNIIKLLLFYILLFNLSICNQLYSQELNYLEVKPRAGDGIEILLQRYELSSNIDDINNFIKLNEGKFTKNNGLLLINTYKLPIKVYKYDNTSIRSTIGNNDWDYAVSIQKYNERMHSRGVKSGDYRKDLELWVPENNLKSHNEKKVEKPKLLTLVQPVFGKKYEEVRQRDFKLLGHHFYLVSGHGGPDPGAIGEHNNTELHEDEYAYDVTLRLARRLMEHSATVHIIVQDPKDGIRDETYLNNSFDEFYVGGDTISHIQVERLQKRADIINEIYEAEKSKAKSQTALMMHVDSRSYGQRIDIFFYHHEASIAGYEIATTLQETIRDKYRRAQPNRGYEGTVTHRSLFMLRNTIPTSVFIELGNIRNPQDQLRFLDKNNRQAIANWLTEGLINAVGNK